MAERVYGSLPSSSSESLSELPPLEELLRQQPVGKSKQAISKQENFGDDENTRKNSIDKASNKESSANANKTSIDITNIDMASSDMTSTTSNGEDNGRDLGFIPPADNISATIFVPITESTKLLSPPQFVPGSFEYHRAALNLVTSHEASVRNNIQAYYQREMRRINLEAEALNPSFDYFNAVANARNEHETELRFALDAMIANMRERDIPAADYNAGTLPLPDLDKVAVTYVPLNSPRESAAHGVMKVIAAATTEMSSFDNHVRRMTDDIKAQMKAAALRSQKQARMDVD
ncbi:hypothetical protein V8C42DRAFT_326672 [Trichoderma barbatum]